MTVSPNEVFALVAYQVGAFQAIATSLGVRPNHVKPHGALYNMAARDPSLAEAVAQGSSRGPFAYSFRRAGGSALARAARRSNSGRPGSFLLTEIIARWLACPAQRPDALLHNAEEAAERVLRMLRENVVQAVDGTDIAIQAETICVHGDTPDAIRFAQKLRASSPRKESQWRRRELDEAMQKRLRRWSQASC